MNFSQKDNKFSNEYPIVGPEFGDLHQQREKFIEENRATYRAEPVVPVIKGLKPLNGKRYPATRRWFTPTGSYERNGFFNIHTHTFNTKWLYYSFFMFVLWGSVQPILQFRYNEIYHDNNEMGELMYDKLTGRTIPGYKLWNRPS